jgi:polyisoprenoid-binding protein YceI
MKTNLLKPFTKPQTLASTLVLLLLLACKPATEPAAENKAPDAPAPAAPAATPTPAPAAPAASDAAQAVTATGLVRYDAQPVGSKAKMEGTSTIHDWTMESAVIGGFMEVDAKFPESALTDSAAAKPKVEAFMPVRSFKSYNKRMDEVMQETMSEPKYKKIEYKLIELKPKSKPGSTGALQFDAVGALTINGVTKTNTMPVAIEKKDGKIKVTGSVPLKMTDFGVKPPAPTIGLGLIKTGDDIKISIEWLTAPKAP